MALVGGGLGKGVIMIFTKEELEFMISFFNRIHPMSKRMGVVNSFLNYCKSKNVEVDSDNFWKQCGFVVYKCPHCGTNKVIRIDEERNDMFCVVCGRFIKEVK